MGYSSIANLHNTRYKRRVPTVPRLFFSTNASAGQNVDIFGEPFTVSSYQPPFTPGLPNAACDLAIIQHEFFNYNLDILDMVTEDNLQNRLQQYQRLQIWRDALPPHLRHEHNPTPGTGFLRCVDSGTV